MKQGFTLIELMVAVAILSLGIVIIYQSFFSILNYFNYYIDYLDVAYWPDEEIWQIKEEWDKNGDFTYMEGEKTLVKGKKAYRCNLAFSPVESDLYKIHLILSWREGKRNIHLSRTTYVVNQEQKQNNL